MSDNNEQNAERYLKSLQIPIDWICYFGLKWWKTTEFLDNYAKPLEERILHLESENTALKLEVEKLKEVLRDTISRYRYVIKDLNPNDERVLDRAEQVLKEN